VTARVQLQTKKSLVVDFKELSISDSDKCSSLEEVYLADRNLKRFVIMCCVFMTTA
jgi:hypothetical protein